MELSSHWLPKPDDRLSSQQEANLESVYARDVINKDRIWIQRDFSVPVWKACSWLCDEKQLLLHGSGNPSIDRFEPRIPHDRSADDFSKQMAVFATSDGIWPLFYAILDRDHYSVRFLNAALRFRQSSGEWSGLRYFFSLSEDVLRQGPWREGVVYVLPREGFEKQEPYYLKERMVDEPHWACHRSVQPLAKLRVTPTDFPFLDQVRGHDDEVVQARAQADPQGFPWLGGYN